MRKQRSHFHINVSREKNKTAKEKPPWGFGSGCLWIHTTFSKASRRFRACPAAWNRLGFLTHSGHVHVLGQYSLSKWITEDPQRIMPTLLGCTASQRDLSTSTHKLSVAMLFHGIYFHTLGVGDLVYHHPGSLCAA